MTEFLWDASHYDGVLDRVTMARAKAEGIVGFTHKIGEGLSNDDPLDGTCLAAARDAGIKLLGGYYIPHQGLPPGAEADRCVALADRDEGWWRTFPGWFWQVDAERWTLTDRVTKTEIKLFSDRLVERTGRVVVVYASRGQYGNDLAGLDYPLWNAAYPSGAHAPFRSLYPGDAHPSWRPYSGQNPVFWQYSSSATIAGKTTCDISAYRGTLAELTALLTGGDTMPGLTPQQQYIQHVLNYRLEALIANRLAYTVPAFTADDGSKFPAIAGPNGTAVAMKTIMDTLRAISTTPGGTVDAAAIAAAVAAQVDTHVRDAVADLGEGGAVKVRHDTNPTG